MSAQDQQQVDQAIAQFFLHDTTRRVTRSVEFAGAYALFTVLLYCRLLCPGGAGLWQWLAPDPFWFLVFLPLFLLDWRNVRYCLKYLRANSDQFESMLWQRYMVTYVCETLYKVLLCSHLAFKDAQQYLTLKVILIPYALGYILYFVLGHLAMEEMERTGSCNVGAKYASDLCRFLCFVLIVSVTVKLGSGGAVTYDWTSAFWPCWGLEGILILLLTTMPFCVDYTVVDRAGMLMLVWVTLSGIGFCVASLMSLASVTNLLEKQLCTDGIHTGVREVAATSPHCQLALHQVLWPWLIFLPSFSLVTASARPRLARALHEFWYQEASPRPDPETGTGGLPLPAFQPEEELPPPKVLFRVTATYYSRVYDPSVYLYVEAAAAEVATPLRAGAALPSVLTSMHTDSHLTAGRSVLDRSVLDRSSSILSFRGTDFCDIVDSEQLCYICYDRKPDAVLLECGHAGLCVSCAEELQEQRRPGAQAQCPICRGPIQCMVRLRPDLPLPRGLFAPLRCRPPGGVPGGQEAAGTSSGRPQGSSAAAGSGAVPGDSSGPPWPPGAKRHAVPVEDLGRREQPGNNAWFFRRR